MKIIKQSAVTIEFNDEELRKLQNVCDIANFAIERRQDPRIYGERKAIQEFIQIINNI